MKQTALLIIDVQNGMFLEENPVFNSEKLLFNLKQLIVHARHNHIPIFFIQHNAPIGRALENGTEGWKIHPEITPTKADTVIQKTTPDSFYRTNLEEELKKQQITNLILTGIQSEVCVDTTCRSAYRLDYKITLVTDAHSTWDSSQLSAQQIIDHHNHVLQWFAQPKKTKDIILYT
ncbi:MAG: cysteine hydrolase family protein [Bacillaceae bacterium]